MKFFNIAGYLSLFFGMMALIFGVQAMMGNFQTIILAIPASILGFIFSIIYIFIKTKRDIKTGFLNQGIVGMLMSSVPVIVLMYFIFTQGK